MTVHEPFEANASEALPTFVTGFGQHDTHAVFLENNRPNPHPSAGTPYGTISFAEIAKLVRAPQRVLKAKARWAIPSTYREHDARNHGAQAAFGTFWLLTVDLHQGNLSLAQVIDALRRILGDVTFVVYSSRSSTADDRKWRGLIPLRAPLSGADFPDTQNVLFDLLEETGLVGLNRPGSTGG